MTTQRIRELNDTFRRTFTGGRVMLTSGVDALPPDKKAKVLHAVRLFDAFDNDNDSHHEQHHGQARVRGRSRPCSARPARGRVRAACRRKRPGDEGDRQEREASDHGIPLDVLG